MKEHKLINFYMRNINIILVIYIYIFYFYLTLIKINTIKKRYDLSKLILKNTPLSITLKNSNDEGTQTYRFLNEKY